MSISVEQGANGTLLEVGPNHSDRAGWLARLEDSFGTSGTGFAIAQLNQLIRSCQASDQKIDNQKLNSMLAIVDGAKPENEIQAMLAIQMAMTHTAALDILRRAQRVDQIPQVDSAGNLAVKLLRTFTSQVEALAKLQRGGEQVVKVVHVHPGAQAVIGDVHASARGGGDDEKGSQPHAKAEPAAIATSAGQEMPSLDAARQPLPVASGLREAPLPDARRG